MEQVLSSVKTWAGSVPFTTWLALGIWGVLFYVFIKLEFGIVFFVLSIFYFLWRSLGKRQGGLSAYSVFNPNVAALPGTYNANDFDQQLRGGFVAGAAQQEAEPENVAERWRAFEGEGQRLGGAGEDHERKYQAWLENIDRAHAAARGTQPQMPPPKQKKEKKNKPQKQETKKNDTEPKRRNITARPPPSSSSPKPAVISSDLQAMLSSLNS